MSNVEGFGKRLKEALDEANITQSQLAEYLRCSKALVSSWIGGDTLPTTQRISKIKDFLRQKGESYTVDWLLSGEKSLHNTEHEHKGLTWLEEIPKSVADPDYIQLGIDFFRSFVYKNRPFKELKTEPRFNHSWSYVASAFQAALRSGALRITQVPRDKSLEDKICKKFKLNPDHVKIARVPQTNIGSLIRSEFVAFLAANEILPQVKAEKRIGISSGYTMLRFAELSSPGSDQFSGLLWLPLEASRDDEIDLMPYSANHIALLMAHRHGGRALQFPYTDHHATKRQKKLCENVLFEAKSLNTVFLSVNGAGRRPESDKYLQDQFQTANHVPVKTLYDSYQKLQTREDDLAGNMLGMMLHKSGELMLEEPNIVSQVPLSVLRTIHETGMICIVAGRMYKAKCTLTALRNNLANALVIDSDIAEYLIANGL